MNDDILASLHHSFASYQFVAPHEVSQDVEVQKPQSWLHLANCFLVAHEWHQMGSQPNLTVIGETAYVCRGQSSSQLPIPVLPLVAARWGVLLACTVSLLMHYG